MNSTKVITYAIVAVFIYIIGVTSFIFTSPVIGSLSFTESNDSTSGRYPNDRIDPNMAFLMFPEEISVNVNDTFSIIVGVENATDMFGWQVYLTFNSNMLNCTNVYLPFEHVFSYGTTVGSALIEYNATEFTNPLYRIMNNESWVIAGNCFLGKNQSTFNGSGTLCHIEFRVTSMGVSPIKLLLYSNFDSYILDSRISAVKPLLPAKSMVTCP
ncbi:MAG: cohesin domain-containing protein [Candidatus Bathyarchaeota archaeon]